MKNIIIITLTLALLAMTWLAWRNSGLPNCVEIIDYNDGGASCLSNQTEVLNPR